MIPRLLSIALVIVATTASIFSADGLKLSWTNNLLTVASPDLPGKTMDIWYLEAFCRKGSTRQDWGKTTIPHKTSLLESDPSGKRLKFRTTVGPNVEVTHVLRAGSDEIDIAYEITNRGAEIAPVEWFQPACIRVAKFTGRDQAGYTARSFIFTEQGLVTLDKTRRTEEAIYRGGQVYVPKGIHLEDVNPRPLCKDAPVNGLIGCFSEDDKWIMATAFDQTHELFEGVYVCLHSDPHIGGVAPGKSKKIRGKIYFLPNDIPALLKRYEMDFPRRPNQ